MTGLSEREQPLRCGRSNPDDAVIDAADEDELVAKVQQHVREDHGLDHTMPAKHIFARLRRDGPRHDAST